MISNRPTNDLFVVILGLLSLGGCGNGQDKQDVVGALANASSESTLTPDSMAEKLPETALSKSIQTAEDGSCLSFDFAILKAELTSGGYSNTLQQLRGLRPPPKQLLRTLEQVRSYVEDDPGQLWFQLQARTRLKGFERFQSELLRQKPESSLVALTTRLDQAWPAVLTNFDFKNPNHPTNHRQEISTLELSSDRKQLFIGLENGLCSMDVETGQISRRLELDPHGRPFRILSHDQEDFCLYWKAGHPELGPDTNVREFMRLYRCKDKSKVCDFSGTREAGYSLNESGGACLSSDGRFLIASSRFRGGVLVYSAKTGEFVRAIMPKTDVARHSDQVELTRMLADGKTLLTVGDYGAVRVYNFESGEEAEPPAQIPLKELRAGFAMNAAETLIVAGTCTYEAESTENIEMTLTVWNIANREVVASVILPNDQARGLAFLPDDSIVAGTKHGKLLLWKGVANSQPRLTQISVGGVSQPVPSPDGRRAFVCDRFGFIKTVDLSATDSTPEEFPFEGLPVAISGDGQRQILVGEKDVILRAIDKKFPDQKRPLKDLNELGQLWTAGLDAADGTICLGGDGAVAHWNPGQSNSPVVKLVQKGEFSLVSPQQAEVFRRDRRDQQVRNDGQKLSAYLPPEGNDRVVCSLDGRFAVMWNQKQLGIFDAKTGQQRTVIRPEGSMLLREYGLFSGNRLAIHSLGPQGATIRIFDIEKGAEIRNIAYGSGSTGMAFSPRTGTIAISESRSVVSIDVNSGELTRANYPSPDFGRIVAFSTDGLRVISVFDLHGEIRVWEFPKLSLVQRYDLGLRYAQFTSNGIAIEVTRDHSRDPKLRHVLSYE